MKTIDEMMRLALDGDIATQEVLFVRTGNIKFINTDNELVSIDGVLIDMEFPPYQKETHDGSFLIKYATREKRTMRVLPVVSVELTSHAPCKWTGIDYSIERWCHAGAITGVLSSDEPLRTQAILDEVLTRRNRLSSAKRRVAVVKQQLRAKWDMNGYLDHSIRGTRQRSKVGLAQLISDMGTVRMMEGAV